MLENAEPSLDLVHPGAMHGRKVADEAGRIAKPGLNQFPLMHFHIVQDQENTGDGTRNSELQQGKEEKDARV